MNLYKKIIIVQSMWTLANQNCYLNENCFGIMFHSQTAVSLSLTTQQALNINFSFFFPSVCFIMPQKATGSILIKRKQFSDFVSDKKNANWETGSTAYSHAVNYVVVESVRQGFETQERLLILMNVKNNIFQLYHNSHGINAQF